MTASKPIITVVTATGAQGRSVCRAFNKTGKWHVRALTRNADGVVAKQYKDEGMEVIVADFENKLDLVKAFTGAYAVFGVTIPPWHQKYTNKLSEYEQGVVQADAAKEADVQMFIWSTLPHVGKAFMGLGGVELYDMKAAINDYLVSINVPSIFIGTPAFIDNVHNWPLVKWTDETETSLKFWNHVVEKDHPVAFLWVERDLGNSCLALVSTIYDTKQPASFHALNHTLQPLASWRGTWAQVSKEIEKQMGVPTTHVVEPDVNNRWNIELTKAFIYQNNHGLWPDTPFPPKTFTDLGVEFGTLEEYVRTKVALVIRGNPWFDKGADLRR